MNRLTLALFVVLLSVRPSSAREEWVNLSDYVAKAQAIVICNVEKDNGDGSVTVKISETLKGRLQDRRILLGETGHCVIRGPVSRFMTVNNSYLVFVFREDKVGRLGGILQIEDGKTLVFSFIDGFSGGKRDPNGVYTLPLEDGLTQIKSLLGTDAKQAVDTKPSRRSPASPSTAAKRTIP